MMHIGNYFLILSADHIGLMRMLIISVVLIFYIYFISIYHNAKKTNHFLQLLYISSQLQPAFNTQINALKSENSDSVSAAIASCLDIGIVNSFSSGLGGGGFVLIDSS